MRDIEFTDINIEAARKLEQQPRKVSMNAEPEPEIINTLSPPDEVGSSNVD